jgi:hypothetical protein
MNDVPNSNCLLERLCKLEKLLIEDGQMEDLYKFLKIESGQYKYMQKHFRTRRKSPNQINDSATSQGALKWKIPSISKGVRSGFKDLFGRPNAPSVRKHKCQLDLWRASYWFSSVRLFSVACVSRVHSRPYFQQPYSKRAISINREKKRVTFG